jgi:hypothetical protein
MTDRLMDGQTENELILVGMGNLSVPPGKTVGYLVGGVNIAFNCL